MFGFLFKKQGLKLTFHKNTPKNRERYLKPGRLCLTIYPGAVNISRSIYRGEKGWSGYDAGFFSTHLPPDAPAFFADGTVAGFEKENF